MFQVVCGMKNRKGVVINALDNEEVEGAARKQGKSRWDSFWKMIYGST